MDILKSLEDQVRYIKSISVHLNLDAILTHIKRAEYLYKKGKDKDDKDYFTDVVYRTNQAFEGSLRQAYLVLTNQYKNQKDKKPKTIFQIETYLENNTGLNERVLQYFTIYRQEWRNKSTHDFRLFFDEKEAFLAIVNVSAYVYVLFEQIIEELSYRYEEEKLRAKTKIKDRVNEILSDDETEVNEKIVGLIYEYSYFNDLDSDFNENEIIGQFSAFLEFSSDRISVERNKLFQFDDGIIEIDLFVTLDNEKFVIEIKNGQIREKESIHRQLVNYMANIDVNHGILWFPHKVDRRKIRMTKQTEYVLDDEVYIISVIEDYEIARNNIRNI